MQQHAPEALDLTRETPRRRSELYGTRRPRDRRLRPPLPARPAAARARRAVRAGLERRRRADATTGTTTPTSSRNCRRSRARSISPTAALLHDLNDRGMLDDTLVVWSTEFGRSRSPRARPAATTTAAPPSPGWPGRASRRASPTARATSGPGGPAKGKTYCYDLHATILHLLGIDHTQADLPPQRHRPPPDRRARPGDQRDPGLTQSAPTISLRRSVMTVSRQTPLSFPIRSRLPMSRKPHRSCIRRLATFSGKVEP